MAIWEDFMTTMENALEKELFILIYDLHEPTMVKVTALLGTSDFSRLDLKFHPMKTCPSEAHYSIAVPKEDALIIYDMVSKECGDHIGITKDRNYS